MCRTSWITTYLLYGVRIALASLLISVGVGFLHAEASDRTIGQFVHTSWSAKDGAPGNVHALAQTTDGFLWLGTTQGLYRFDGVSFERYEPQSGPAFQSSNVTSLLALPNGDLWIGFREQGMSRLRGGHNTNYRKADGLPSGRVSKLVQDRDGAIWAGTNGGLARFEHEQWQRVGDDWGYPGRRAVAVYVDRDGTLWVASENTIAFLPRASRKFNSSGVETGQVNQMVESPDGTLWLAETTRSVHPIRLPANQHGFEPEIKLGSAGILFDDDGSLWITSLGDGMRRVPFPGRLKGQKIGEFSDAIESLTSKDGLSSDYVTCILKDREGSIWVGTSAGLDRFRKGALVPILLPAKFTQKTLVAGDDGNIWVGSMSNALARIDGKTWEDINPDVTTLQGVRDSHGTIWLLNCDFRLTLHCYVSRLAKERALFVAATPAEFDTSASYMVLVVDRSGTLWLGAGALYFLKKNGQWEQFETPSEVAAKTALVTFTDPDGRIWFGFPDNTVLVMDGTNVRTFSAKDGIQVGTVKAITGRDHHIWIGGEGGLAVWNEDHFRPVLPAGSDAFHGVSGVQEDSGGDVFLSDERGVVFIPATEVSKILKNPSARIQYRLFDVHDGVPGAVQQTPPYPTSVQGTDGRIWFSTSTGVAWIDPAHIPRNLLEPPITIRAITANGTRYTSPAGLTLPPRTRDLMIDCTALSLAVPDRVRFRYKLEGSDTQWQDAGTRRQAFYTNLSPGQYRFRVLACNNDGVWNESGASVNFKVAAAWYQTNWFRSLCAVGFLALLWGIYQLRVQQLQRQFDIGLEARVNERTRIARDLHDTLLQSIQGLMLHFQTGIDLLPGHPAEARKTLEIALDRADQAIAEGRDAVQGLRASTVETNDLASAIRTLGEELRAEGINQNSALFEMEVEGTPRNLHPILRDEVYRIAGEALRNAFRHARAQRVEVEILYGERSLRLRIRDDGKGIDPKVLSGDGLAGHYGLHGMRERAKLVGGRLAVWSKLDSGTEVELSIPASTAYANPARHRSWLSEKLSGQRTDFKETEVKETKTKS